MNTIIISILAFLLSIFPGCGMLQTPDQSMTFPGEAVVTDNIMAAIEEKDTAAIENLASQKLKQNGENLSSEINAIIDCIDGKVVEYEWYGGSDYDKSSFGARISRTSWIVEFTTDIESYTLVIGWVVVNNRTPDDVGMRSMAIRDSENNLLEKLSAPIE